MSRRAPTRTVAAVVVALVVAAAAPSPAGADGRWDALGLGCLPRPAVPAPGGRVMASTVAGAGRLRTYTVASGLVGPTRVSVLLPVGFDPSGRTRYPVLYLLHGAGGSYADWASTAWSLGQPAGGDVAAIVGGAPVLVVMPDGSRDGSYTDWFGLSRVNVLAGQREAPSWESFAVDELVPWVDATFPTQAGAAGRAIAGVSSGGGGAMKYAAAHPGLFGAAGSFSGAVDTDLVDATTDWYAEFATGAGLLAPDAFCTYGDPDPGDSPNQAYYWHDNDPTYEAANLAGTRLWVASGDGLPGALDNPLLVALLGASKVGAIERTVDDMSHHLVGALQSAGLGAEVTTDFYGAGLHEWAYWQQDLRSFLAWWRPPAAGPGAPRPAPVSVHRPATFSFRTARAASAAWGWSFGHRSGLAIPTLNTAEEFVYLSGVSAGGLRAAGHGTLSVATPGSLYAAGSVHTVRVRGATGVTTQRVRASAAGALAFPVVLGPPARASQAQFPPAGPPPSFPSVRVTISR